MLCYIIHFSISEAYNKHSQCYKCQTLMPHVQVWWHAHSYCQVCLAQLDITLVIMKYYGPRCLLISNTNLTISNASLRVWYYRPGLDDVYQVIIWLLPFCQFYPLAHASAAIVQSNNPPSQIGEFRVIQLWENPNWNKNTSKSFCCILSLCLTFLSILV